MKLTYWKIIVALLLFFGEGLTILAEISSAHQLSRHVTPFMEIFATQMVLIVFACLLIVAAYVIGVKKLASVWVVTAISILAILLVEPVVVWLFFRTLPERGALIGLIFGAIGFVCSCLF